MKNAHKPVLINDSEAVIEVFWDLGFEAPKRWDLSASQGAKDARFREFWDGWRIAWDGTGRGGVVSIRRDFSMKLGPYDGLTFRLAAAAEITVMLKATTDGGAFMLPEPAPGVNRPEEYHLALKGNHLKSITVELSNTATGKQEVWLQWALLTKPVMVQALPAKPFAGLVSARPRGNSFKPHHEILLTEDNLKDLRKQVETPSMAPVWAETRARAAAQAQLDPRTVLRPFSLCTQDRYGRTADLGRDLGPDGELLALVGLIDRNSEYLRRAAECAIATAMIEEWAEGFISRFPGSSWTHASFASSQATVKASLLLDLTWNYLTPQGRDFIADAIITKGLSWIEALFRAGSPHTLRTNQGIVFTQGRLIGTLAARHRLRGDLGSKVEKYIDVVNAIVPHSVLEDGGCSEGTAYWAYTFQCSLPVYTAAANYLGKQLAEIVPERVKLGGRFALAMTRTAGTPGTMVNINDSGGGRTIPERLAMLFAGPLGMKEFRSLCTPMAPDSVMSAVALCWAPKLVVKRTVPAAKQFHVFRTLQLIDMRPFAKSAATRAQFNSGVWSEGHSQGDKNSFLLEAYGADLLIDRAVGSYADPRNPLIVRTAAHNTLTPGERSQVGDRKCDSKLHGADDLDVLAFVESDAAKAWPQGVKRSLRRFILIRPNVVIIEDTAEYEDDEPATANFNSPGTWKKSARGGMFTEKGVRLDIIKVLPAHSKICCAEDSVDFGDCVERKVNRATVTSPAARQHRIITILRVIPPKGAKEPVPTVRVNRAKNSVSIKQGKAVAQLLYGPGDQMKTTECSTDGQLLVVAAHPGKGRAAIAFGATWLQVGDAKKQAKQVSTLHVRSTTAR